MLADRTLYENIKLDKEPKRPVLVSAPEPLSESAPAGRKAKGAEEDDRAGAKPPARDEWSSDESDDGGGEAEEEWASAASLPCPSASSSSAITLSSLPRSHWETLFSLDLVRARNRPVEPVKPPPAAPFFLPTLRGENGLAPTFGKGTASFAAVGEANVAPQKGGKEEHDPAGWGDKWSDDDEDNGAANDDGYDKAEDEEDEGLSEVKSGKGSRGGDADSGAAARAAAASSGLVGLALGAGTSRLLRRTKPLELPRCRLAEALLAWSKGKDAGAKGAEEEEEEEEEDSVFALLKSLNPSAVDAELNGLCRGDAEVITKPPVCTSACRGTLNSSSIQSSTFPLTPPLAGLLQDLVGVELLGLFLAWLGPRLSGGCDFELAQAYLHRFLALHAEAIADAKRGSVLAAPLAAAQAAQAAGAERLRCLLQHNLGLIAFFSNAQPF